MAGVLARIEARHFVCGLIIENGRVTQTAPIVKYMRGWTPARVHGYVLRKGWTIARV